MQLPTSVDVRAFLRRVLRPRSKLGKTTLWFGYLAITLEILQAIFRPAPGSILSGWASFISLLFVGFALLMSLRWVRRKLLWRLRNRLIVTYVFIGVIPLILLVAGVLVAAYLFAGQFATYVAMSDLQSELQHLEATNRSLATQFRNLARGGKLNQQLAGEIASASDENFRHRSVSIWAGDKGFVLAEPAQATMPPIKAALALPGDFAGFVLENDRLYLRVVRRVDDGQLHLTVISNLPITAELLRHSASELGAITLDPPDEETSAKASPIAGGQPATAYKNRMSMTTKAGGKTLTIDLSRNSASGPKPVQAGSVPPPTNSLDVEFPFATRLNVTDWESGKSFNGLLVVDTRPSRIYATLFSTLGENAGIFRDLLWVIAIIFGVIELIALFIGVRLTRSMTKSVAELYTATEHVNRGELQHRIQLRTSDQMAALEQSFNSMTQSLSNLIAEQKEKQRMEGELAIAHEVQELLYPDDLSGLPGLEVHGVCRPARTVSGDYYDFIPLSEDRLVIAVGDISGKGISAALLMATVHAFVRAYSLEPERTLASVALGAGVSDSAVVTATGGNGNCHTELSPALLMSTLNYQLFRSTPAAKYATMFLGCYDAGSRLLTYCNAGHLPPLVLGGDGTVRRLETSGTVVGLFDDVAYDQSEVSMQPGDIFVAYSDGITEPENEFGEFGEERLIELILQHRDQSLARISDIVTTAVADWIAGSEQPDDVTLVLARAR